MSAVHQRFWAKVDADGDCWVWTANRHARGYGKFKMNGRTELAHRVAWRMLVGPIDEGLTIDHLCRNTSCVNPDHLEPVTMRENLMRGYSWAAKQTEQTHCKKGHLLSGDNLRRYGAAGSRFCLTCHRRRSREGQRRRRGSDV